MFLCGERRPSGDGTPKHSGAETEHQTDPDMLRTGLSEPSITLH